MSAEETLRVWCVIVYESVDGVYLFREENDAATFAEPYGANASTHEVPVLGREAAARLISEDRESWK